MIGNAPRVRTHALISKGSKRLFHPQGRQALTVRAAIWPASRPAGRATGSVACRSQRRSGFASPCLAITRACDHDPCTCDQDSIACSLDTRPCDDGKPYRCLITIAIYRITRACDSSFYYRWRITRACNEGTRPCCGIPWPCDQTRWAWDGIPRPLAVVSRGLSSCSRPCIKGTSPRDRGTWPCDATSLA